MYLQSGEMYKYSSLNDMRHVTEIFNNKLVYQLPMYPTSISRDHITWNHFELLTLMLTCKKNYKNRNCKKVSPHMFIK